MSNVLKRNRAVSNSEYITKARVIREEITSLVMNEKIVPKRYRYAYSIPMIDLCRNLTHNATTYYNCIGDDDEFFTLYQRKMEALRNMYDCCDNLLDELLSLKNRFYIKLSARQKVVGLLVDEQELIDELIEVENEKHIDLISNK
ncbi:MAG: hypothetical protein LIO71_02945 [Ruminococcus sp.]|nr:hypothetical protein [Ruminococcus sp.]